MLLSPIGDILSSYIFFDMCIDKISPITHKCYVTETLGLGTGILVSSFFSFFSSLTTAKITFLEAQSVLNFHDKNFI